MGTARAPDGDAATAWVLNLDADLELAVAPGAPYRVTNAVRAAMAPHVARLASMILGPRDVLVDESSPAGIARGLPGRAFCPTARAVAILARAGARVERHPAHEVLRAVNGRAFCASLGQTLPGAAFVCDLDAAVRHLATAPPACGRGWRVKRAFGMAGRGQRVLSGSTLSAADLGFLRAAMSEGGVQIEPDVVIERELAMHAMLAEDGSLRTGRLVVQACDAWGQWLTTTIAGPSDADAATRLTIEREVERVGAALHAAGYFGPFGVDAFLYRGEHDAGALALQPRSEINARYSMGFAIGFGAPR